MLQQRHLAVDMMRSGLDRRRSSMRILLAIPAEVVCHEISPRHHAALVRVAPGRCDWVRGEVP